jgi:pyruvate dehydrogenase E1 component beta subunit
MTQMAITEAMREELNRDSNVVLIGEDVAAMGSSLGTSIGFAAEFGTERILDMPVCESAQASFAAGMAMAGKRVILEYMMVDFQAYAFDGIVNQLAKQRYISGGLWEFPVTIRMSQGAGTMVGAHHNQCAEGWYQNVPGLKLCAPGNAKDTYGILKAAIRDNDPVIVFEPKFAMGIPAEVPDADEDFVLEIGKANVVQEGGDVTVIGYQYGLAIAQDVAEDLEDDGISCEVIDLVSLIPYDKETILKSVRKTGRAVIVHESPVRGGFGGEIAAFIAENAFDSLKAPVVRVGGKNLPIPYGPSESHVLPSEKEIKAAIRSVVK